MIGRRGAKELFLCAWPATSPDLTLCDFFLWEYVKDNVYVPPLPANTNAMTDRTTAVIKTVDRNMLRRVGEKFPHRLDVVLASNGGGHIEHM